MRVSAWDVVEAPWDYIKLHSRVTLPSFLDAWLAISQVYRGKAYCPRCKCWLERDDALSAAVGWHEHQRASLTP